MRKSYLKFTKLKNQKLAIFWAKESRYGKFPSMIHHHLRYECPYKQIFHIHDNNASFCPCAQSGRTLYCFFSASRRIALQIRSLYKNQLHESIEAVHSNQDICLNLELGQSMPSYVPRRAFGLKLAYMDQKNNNIVNFFTTWILTIKSTSIHCILQKWQLKQKLRVH